MSRRFDIAVVGAGIAGISAAYQLAVRRRMGSVVLIDPRPPLTLTSDKSTECYRNWWPNAPMVDLVNRSVDLLEDLATETDFGLNRRGYLFVTAEQAKLDDIAAQVNEISRLGATADVLDAGDIAREYPFITGRALGAVRVHRAGWFRAQDLGQWMLEECRTAGVELIRSSVVGIDDGALALSDGSKVDVGKTVIAAGPMSADVAGLAGIDLPLFSELHLKVGFKDHLGVIPRDAPMTIWIDHQAIEWSGEERAELAALGRDDLLGEMPVNCHFRPEGGGDSPYVVALWEYHGAVVEPRWPIPTDPMYPEVVIRGLTTMVPGLAAYRDRLPESVVDGGYYTKTVENRPLIGPTGAEGVFVIAGLSGFGVMVSQGAADLVARHVAGDELPAHSDAFLLSRYERPGYLEELERLPSGQI